MANSFQTPMLKKEKISKDDSDLLKFYKTTKNKLIIEIIKELYTQQEFMQEFDTTKMMEEAMDNFEEQKRLGQPLKRNHSYDPHPDVPPKLRQSVKRNDKRIHELMSLNENIDFLSGHLLYISKVEIKDKK